MKKMLSRIICLGAIVTALMAPVTAHAATKQEAANAYKNFLSQKTITWRDQDGKAMDSCYKMTMSSVKFALVYLDDDSIPELVLYRTKTAAAKHGHKDYMVPTMMLYTYKNSKVQFVSAIRALDTTTFQYFPRTGIYKSIPVDYKNHVQNVFYKYRSGKAWEWMIDDFNRSTSKQVYYLVQGSQDKQISEKCFENQLEKYVKDVEYSCKAFCTNTAANRAKFIK